MGLRSFIALDIETTGADPSTDRIIEIGAIRYENGQEVDVLSQLIDPRQAIPLRIQNLTGILPDMVKGKPTFGQIAARLSELVGESLAT